MSKFTLADIQGATEVRLITGEIVKISDIRQKGGALNEDYIIVSCIEWYPFSAIAEITKKRSERI